MSKIGKINISIPEKVKVILSGSDINIEGPFGKQSIKINLDMFDLKVKNFNGKEKLIKNINLNLTGDYNVKNATAALSVSLTLGIKINIIKEALKNFSGVQRRMTKIFSKNRNDFYDDVCRHGNRGGYFPTSLAYYAVWPKKKIQHNKCHTDNMKIKDLHGHTEPHV